MNGHALYELYLEGWGGSRMNHLIFLPDQVCRYNQRKRKSIRVECQEQEVCGVTKATANRYFKELEGTYLEGGSETGRGTYYKIKGSQRAHEEGVLQ